MFEILYDSIDYDFLDQLSCDEILALRKDFSIFNIKDLTIERPLLVSEKYLTFFSFTGTSINRTIRLLLKIVDINHRYDEESSTFELEESKETFTKQWKALAALLDNIDLHITTHFRENPSLLSFSKWGIYLPEDYQVKLIKNTYFDLEGTRNYLTNTHLILN